MNNGSATYHSSGQYYGKKPGVFSGAPVTKWLMISCIAIYFIPLFMGDQMVLRVRGHGAFTVETVLSKMQLWRVISYQFLHGGGVHIAMNMMGLFFFGRFFEETIGSRRYIGFYLISGIGGALFFTLLYYAGFFPSIAGYTPLVGASAAIYGCMMGVAYLAPDIRVYLFFLPIPIKIKYIIYGIVAYGICIVLMRGQDFTSNAGGEAGHLGGLLLGFLLSRNTHWLNFLDKKVIRQSYKRRKARQTVDTKIKPRTRLDLSDSEVDEILDKVSSHGFQSLTDEEKMILQKAANNE